uniref:Uncharacterized protein n=1 Tax=Panagrolaimus sp. JU765 TaxID=591449 RepID=A0AC34QT06_9BILA
MAFIVPVMKKDYVLYNQTEKKKDRSNSSPIEIRTKNDATPRLSRLSCSVDIVGPSSPPIQFQVISSAPTTPKRRNHRVSIRRLNSESDIEVPKSAPPTIGSHKQVRFGFLEEIEFNEQDEQMIDNEPYTPTKDVTIQPCLKKPCSFEATPKAFKKNAVFKLVTFCSSKKSAR